MFLAVSPSHTSRKSTRRADALDVYVDRSFRVWLLDFGPFAGATDALLFDWEELTAPAPAADGGEPELRLVESPGDMRPAELMGYRLPKDVLNMTLTDQQNVAAYAAAQARAQQEQQ
jgi:hypothetical protein